MTTWTKNRSLIVTAGAVVADPDWKTNQNLDNPLAIIQRPKSHTGKDVIPCTGIRILLLQYKAGGILPASGSVTFEVLEWVPTDSGVTLIEWGADLVVNLGNSDTNPALPVGEYVLRVKSSAGLDATATRIDVLSKTV